MKLEKLLLTIVLLSMHFQVHALNLSNFFYDDYLHIKIILNPGLISDIRFNESLELDNYDYIRLDPENLVNPAFHIPEYLAKSVKFWFDVYTKYDENTTIIHDKINFDLIYNTINFDEFEENKVSKITKANFRKQIERERVAEIRQAIGNIFNKKNLNTFELTILEQMAQAGITVPENKNQRKQIMQQLLRGLRRQSGLKNQIDQGLVHYENHYSFFKKYLSLFDLPEEIMSIAFVESSFNPKAHSKADAVGIWQFINSTGKAFLEISPINDERRNLLLSTLGAFHLLRQNYQIHKSWPFSISAYNSGHKHILKARRLFPNKETGFQQFLEKYSHADIKFASKNYYCEFLAMSFAIKYRKYFYAHSSSGTNKDFFLYQNLKPINFSKIASRLNMNLDSLIKYNPQIWPKTIIPPRQTLVFDSVIADPDFKNIDDKYVRKYFPKNFKKIP